MFVHCKGVWLTCKCKCKSFFFFFGGGGGWGENPLQKKVKKTSQIPFSGLFTTSNTVISTGFHIVSTTTAVNCFILLLQFSSLKKTEMSLKKKTEALGFILVRILLLLTCILSSLNNVKVAYDRKAYM